MSAELVTARTPTWGKLKIILSLSLPAMVENILQTVVGFVDMLFVSKLGLIEITAVGVTNSIMAVYIAIFTAIGVGAASLIARSVGAGDLERARAIARKATWVSAIAGILLGLTALLFTEPFLRMMGAGQEVIESATVYFRIVGVNSIFIALMSVFGAILRAHGDTMTPMRIGFWMNAVHIVLDYVLIFGFLLIPGFGLLGAACSTVLVRAVSAVVLYLRIRKSSMAFPLFSPSRNKDVELTKELLTVATPAAIEGLVMRGGQVLYFGLIVSLGTQVFAAHTIAGNIELFAYMPGYGLAVAAATMVGKNIGAKRQREAYEYAMLTALVGVVVQGVAGVVLFVGTPWFATWFTSSEQVIGMVTIALRINAFAQPALAVCLILAGALQGAGDTKSPMYSTLIGMWVLRIVGVYLMAIQLNMGISGVWLAILIDLYARAIFLFVRTKKLLANTYSKRKWESE